MGLKLDPSQFTVQLMEPINKLQLTETFIQMIRNFSNQSTACYIIIAILYYRIIQLLFDGR